MRTVMGALIGSVLILTTSGCSPDADEVDEPSQGEVRRIESADCPSLLPDDVITSLGWSEAGDATYAPEEQCTRTTAEGTVEVTRRAVPAVGGDDLPAKAGETFDERCSGFDAEDSIDFVEPSEGSQACATVEGGRSISSLVLLTGDNAVIEIRVDADADTLTAQVEAGLAAAATAADQTF